jgi:hypothetical protein
MAKKLTAQEQEQKKLVIQAKKLEILSSIIQTRSAVAAKLGKSFGNKRDLYETLGYPGLDAIDHDNCLAKFRRQDIAQRIVKAMPEESWEKDPEITDSSEGDSSFETEWSNLVKKFKIYSVMRRADILSGIGEYSVIMIGFNDGKDPREPVDSASEVLYLQPYGQWSAQIHKLNDDPQSERYNRPDAYQISFSEPSTIGESKRIRELEVHHSRIIHIARNLLESEVYGTMELEAVYNRLENLELIAGGSAEMFWQGAMRGLAFLAHEDYDITETAAELTEEIDKYVHGLQRYMKLQGMDIKTLDANIASPRDAFDIQIDLISATKGMPKRILLGSERGELASTQDDENWTSRVEARRVDVNENIILRPFIDKMIEVGVIPAPPGEEFSIEWPPLTEPTPKDQAEVGKTISQAIREFYSSPGAETIPLDIFLGEIVNLPEEKVSRVRDEIDKLMDELKKEDEEGRQFEQEMDEELEVEDVRAPAEA